MGSKRTFSVALGGIVSAISLVLLLLASIFPFGTYAFPCFAGMLLLIIIYEIGYPLTIGVYIAVSILSFLIVPDKESVLYYVMFLGFYPIIKNKLDTISSIVLRYLLKILIFNVCIIAAFYIGLFLLSIPKDSFTIFGLYLPYVFLIIGNIFFIIYDLCLNVLLRMYIIKLHPIISRKR